MSDVNETMTKRLQSLYRLSIDPGATAGERDNAKYKITLLMNKYGLTPDDVNPANKEIFFFIYQKKWEVKLLKQIVGYVTEASQVVSYSKFNAKGRKLRKLGFKLTKADYIEVKRLYDIYRKAFLDELENLVNAFIHKHGIYPPVTENSISTDFDWNRFNQMVSLSKSLNDVQVFPQIEGE